MKICILSTGNTVYLWYLHQYNNISSLHMLLNNYMVILLFTLVDSCNIAYEPLFRKGSLKVFKFIRDKRGEPCFMFAEGGGRGAEKESDS